jgi:hypothetical protein
MLNAQDVGANRRKGEAEPSGDQDILHALGDELGDLALARAQPPDGGVACQRGVRPAGIAVGLSHTCTNAEIGPSGTLFAATPRTCRIGPQIAYNRQASGTDRRRSPTAGGGVSCSRRSSLTVRRPNGCVWTAIQPARISSSRQVRKSSGASPNCLLRRSSVPMRTALSSASASRMRPCPRTCRASAISRGAVMHSHNDAPTHDVTVSAR